MYNAYTYLNKNQFANKENLEKKDHQCNFKDLIFKLKKSKELSHCNKLKLSSPSIFLKPADVDSRYFKLSYLLDQII